MAGAFAGSSDVIDTSGSDVPLSESSPLATATDKTTRDSRGSRARLSDECRIARIYWEANADELMNRVQTYCMKNYIGHRNCQFRST